VFLSAKEAKKLGFWGQNEKLIRALFGMPDYREIKLYSLNSTKIFQQLSMDLTYALCSTVKLSYNYHGYSYSKIINHDINEKN